MQERNIKQWDKKTKLEQIMDEDKTEITRWDEIKQT
jgi:hypothetical protein